MQNEYLMHFNPFHDPKNGQFTSGGSSGVISSLRNRMALNKEIRKSANGEITRKEVNEERKRIEYEAEKQRAIESGNATAVLKFKGDLTPNDLQYAVRRISLERQLMEISDKELDTGKSKAERFFDAMGKGASYINTANNLISATKKLSENLSNNDDKSHETMSQKLAKKYLEENKDKTDKLDSGSLKSTTEFLDNLSKIEKVAKGESGKKKK